MQWLRRIPTTYPKMTLSLGVILLLLSGVYGIGIFSKLASDDSAFNASGTESSRVDKIIARDFNSNASDSIVLFTRTTGTLKVGDAAYQSEVTRLLETLHPTSQTTYYSTGAKSFVANNQHDTYAIVSLEGTADEQARALIDFMNRAKSDFLRVRVGGTAVGQHQTVEQTRHDLELAELISLPIVALLLLLFFRSVVAAVIPLVVAALTICGALAVAHFIQRYTAIDTYTINVISILGLGLSVDYSLLAVNRFREELSHGRSRQKAAEITAHTAGRTIIFSALTVIACLLSLLVFPIGFMKSISIGGAAAVFVAMLVASILMPALFTILGRGIDRLQLPHAKRQKKFLFWRRAAMFGTKHPWVTLASGLCLIGAFLVPVFDVKPAAFDYRVLPKESSAFAVGKALEDDFHARTPSVTLLVSYDHPPAINEMCSTAQTISTMQHVESIVAPYAPSSQLSCEQLEQLDTYQMVPELLSQMSAPLIHGNVTRINITPTGGPTDPTTAELIGALRAQHDSRLTYSVGGSATLSHDSLESYSRYAPYALLIIVGVMLLVLTISLGSLVLPIQAVIINSLGLIIAVGSLVMLYQFGWLQQIFQQTVLGGLNPSMPILICVIAFGLSMDYAVFLYSRMHEIYEKTNDPTKAILDGVEKTGPIITAAALVFFAVVAAFSISHISMMQQIGFGLAVAVLVDAFIIRILFVPAIMRIFGHVSWYAPRWIKRHTFRHDA